MASKRRILLIDDDELWRTNLSCMFMSCGFSVEPVSTWNSAINQLKSSTFHRIVSDLHVVSDARHGIEMLSRMASLNPPKTLVVSKFVGSLSPRIMKQLPFVEFAIEKSRITETAEIWRKFLPYNGAKDVSRLIISQHWIDLSSPRDMRQKIKTLDENSAVSKLLSDLPAKIPDLNERAFLTEAIRCYHNGAYRASIVMTWNLAFDHLLRWIMSDPQRLAAFNDAIPKRYLKKSGMSVAKLEDFEEFKESETIEICSTAKLMSKNVIDILRDKLKRRNAAAHPSLVTIVQAQADDVITDLVNNVVLRQVA